MSRYRVLTAVLLVLTLAAVLTPAMGVQVTGEEGIPRRLRWLFPGFRATYFIVSTSAQIDPWRPPDLATIQEGAWDEVGGGAAAPTIPGEAGKTVAIHGFDFYVVEGFREGGVVIKEVLLGIYESSDLKFENEYIAMPSDKGFHGPFWIDPAVLREVRVGDEVVLGTPDKPEVWKVFFVGRLDISPLPTAGGTEKLESMGAVAIPVPEGTVREVVVLYTEEKGRKYKMIVDRESGIILYAVSRELRGGVTPLGQLKPLKSMMTFKMLAEATYDFENRLPPYREFRIHPLIRGGYAVGSYVQFADPMMRMVTIQWWYVIAGMYKDRALVMESIVVVDFNMNVHAEVPVWLVDLKSGKAEVIEVALFMGSGTLRKKGDVEDKIPILVGELRGRKTLRLFNTDYRLEEVEEGKLGYKAVEPSGDLWIDALVYNEEGLLLGFAPSINYPGLPLSPFLPPVSASNSEDLTKVYVKPQFPEAAPEPLDTGGEGSSQELLETHPAVTTTTATQGTLTTTTTTSENQLGQLEETVTQGSQQEPGGDELTITINLARRHIYYVIIIALLAVILVLLLRRKRGI